MSELSAAQKKYYTEQAESHADFLCEKVFKPAFLMAFIHGVKHGREDLKKESGLTDGFKSIKSQMSEMKEEDK